MSLSRDSASRRLKMDSKAYEFSEWDLKLKRSAWTYTNLDLASPYSWRVLACRIFWSGEK